MALFFKYLSDPQVQAKSHQETGYLPITIAAFKLTEKSGFYKQNPGTDVSVNQMIRKTTDKSRGIRLGNFVQIRTIIDEELEQVWAGKKSAKQGLDDAKKRGNDARAFEKANKAEALLPTTRAGTPLRPLPAERGGPSQKDDPWPSRSASASRAGGCPGRWWRRSWPSCSSSSSGRPAQALYYSVQQQDAFGTSEAVRRPGELHARCSRDDTYLASFQITAVFSVLVAGLGLSISLLLAVMADRVVKGSAPVQDAADLALRGGAGGGRRAVAVHVRAVDRRGQLRAARGRLRLEPPARRHRTR